MNRICNFKWLLLLLALSGAIAYAEPSQPPSWQTITNDYFDGIKIKGPFDIELIPSATQNRAEIFINDKDLQQLNFSVINNTLNINFNSRSINRQFPSSRWLMRIYTHNLTLLCLYDSANLTANALDSPYLLIEASDDSQVYIRGDVGVFQLSVPNGNPYVDISWINSRNLMVEANGGSISLGGTIQFMQARLSGNTQLEAKRLRADKIWIYATDNALAELVALRTLRAFADSNSNVLYYKKPNYFTDVTEISGNVLQMGYWN
jgi:hypothetical protein